MADPKEILEALRRARDQLRREAEGHLAEGNRILEEARSVDEAISVFMRQNRMVEPAIVDEVRDLPTHPAALVHIARKNGGILRVKDATRLFIEAGRVPNAHNAKATIYTSIGAHLSTIWEKMYPGVYKLVEGANGEG